MWGEILSNGWLIKFSFVWWRITCLLVNVPRNKERIKGDKFLFWIKFSEVRTTAATTSTNIAKLLPKSTSRLALQVIRPTISWGQLAWNLATDADWRFVIFLIEDQTHNLTQPNLTFMKSCNRCGWKVCYLPYWRSIFKKLCKSCFKRIRIKQNSFHLLEAF